MLRANLQSFLLGAVGSFGAGYYFLHQDIWRSADLLGESLGSMITEARGKSAALEKRVAKLEAEVAALKVRASARAEGAVWRAPRAHAPTAPSVAPPFRGGRQSADGPSSASARPRARRWAH